MENKDKDVSLLLQFWRWIFEKFYNLFMRRGWKTKIVILTLGFFVFFWLVTKNIDSILYPFHRENGSTKDHFVWLVEQSRPPVADCHVIFISWLFVIPIMSVLSCRFVRPNILVESEGLCLIPFFLGVKWAFSPVLFLLLASHSIFIALLFRKRYLWIASLFITYFCLSLYFIGVTICFTDITDFF
jgi:hypothetical protein